MNNRTIRTPRFHLPIIPPQLLDDAMVQWEEYYHYFLQPSLSDPTNDLDSIYLNQIVAWVGTVVEASEREVTIVMTPTDNSKYDIRLQCGFFSRFDTNYFRPGRIVFFAGKITRINEDSSSIMWSYDIQYINVRERCLALHSLIQKAAHGDKKSRSKIPALAREIDDAWRQITGPVWLELLKVSGREARFPARLAFNIYFKGVEVKWSGRLRNISRRHKEAQIELNPGCVMLICHICSDRMPQNEIKSGEWVTAVGCLMARGEFRPGKRPAHVQMNGVIYISTEEQNYATMTTGEVSRTSARLMTHYEQRTVALAQAIADAAEEQQRMFERMKRGMDPVRPPQHSRIVHLPSPSLTQASAKPCDQQRQVGLQFHSVKSQNSSHDGQQKQKAPRLTHDTTIIPSDDSVRPRRVSLSGLAEDLMEAAPEFEVYRGIDHVDIQWRREREAERRYLEREMEEKLEEDLRFLQRAHLVGEPDAPLEDYWESDPSYDPLTAYGRLPDFTEETQQFIAGTDGYGDFTYEEPQARFADLDAEVDYWRDGYH